MTNLYCLPPLAICAVFALGVTVGIILIMAVNWAVDRTRRNAR